MALDLQSIYILASGGSRAMEQLDTVTNNLANVNTDGFKKLVIKEMSQRLDENGGDANHLFVFPRFQEALVYNKQGNLKATDNPYDLAIEGEGLFKVMTKDGALYTRNGHFFMNSEGKLVDKNGNFLLSTDEKPITLDPKAPFSVSEDGVIFQNGEQVATIAIESYEKIEAVGDTYYKPAGAMQEPDYRIKQGYLEQSNVNAVTEMTAMITAHRRFEIYSNMIRSLDQLNQKTNEIGKA